MKNNQPLPTANKKWGFWGTSKNNGYDVTLAWNAASSFLADEFGLTPEEARDVLDARFGRHLADDLSFIKGGPISAEAIVKHLKERVSDRGWRNNFETAIHEITGKTFPRKAPLSKEELFMQIAQEHLNIETLVTRKSDSLDFHDVAVWNVLAALDAAFEAGRKARR